MDPSLAFDIANLLLKCSSSPIFKEIKSIWKYEEEINMLTDTIDTIGSWLSRVQGTRFEADELNKGFRRLREVYLDAEDFLDRVQTLKKKEEAMANQIKEAEAEITKPNGKGKLSLAYVGIKMKPSINKGLKFFSSSNQAKHAFEVQSAAKKIKKKLKAISKDHKLVLTEPSSRPETTLTSARATGRYVDATKITGRDEDKMKIVDLLIRSPVDDNKVPVVSIVGIGGMGKTTVAQLVYKDERLQKECQFDKKLWVSDSKKYDLRSLLKHILKSISRTDASLDNLEEDHLEERLVDEIQGKRFLLVLDDVDNEDPHSWEKLEALLKNGNKGGSRILVTTRSRKVAKVVGSLTDSSYKLHGLSEEDSLQLFERFAFEERRAENLAEIGRQIVGKCSGVPLALKVMGSCLKDKNRQQWEFVRDNSFADIGEKENQILPILKLSYDDLDSTAKQCFQYCAICPRNFGMSPQILKSIWKDNVRFKNSDRPLEDPSARNLRILLDRCFLDECGYKGYVFMHDLMHDLAKEVAGPEIRRVDLNPEVDLDKLIAEENVRHLFLTGEKALTVRPKGKGLRTILRRYNGPKITLGGIVSECPVLRMLDLEQCGFVNLPDSIGKLIHLRYLNLSRNEFQTLPNSITELINLRYLGLRYCEDLNHLPSGMGALMSLEHLELDHCTELEELPRGIEKLKKLKRLLMFGCDALGKMPSGMGTLVPVCRPHRFIVGHPESSNHTAQLQELTDIEVQSLKIELPWNITSKVPAWDGQAFLLNKGSLRKLNIEWKDRSYTKEEFSVNCVDSLNSEDEVSTNSMDILAKLRPPPNLEKFSLCLYQGMAFPHDFALNLSNLVSLSIKDCSKLEYIEDNAPAKPFCFPKLEELVLEGLPKLKGWYRGLAVGLNDDSNGHIQLMPSFPCLSFATIRGCPSVTVPFFLSSLKMSLLSSTIEVDTDYGHFYLSKEDKDSLMVIAILCDNLAEPLRAISHHMAHLRIHCCPMIAIRTLYQYLPAVRHLEIRDCPEFTVEEQSVGDEIECLKSLQTLTFTRLPKLLRLPDWILSLASLQVLRIEDCFNLSPGAYSFLRSKDVAGSTFLFEWHIIKDKVSQSIIPSRHALSMIIFGPRESIYAHLKDLEHFLDECTSFVILPCNYTWKAPTGNSDAILLNKKSLRDLWISWPHNENLEEEVWAAHIDILAKLQPPLNLKSFKLAEYQGITFPPWAAGHGFAHGLPNLVSLHIKNCRKCRYLPSMSGLECLKELELQELSNLEYIEENVSTTGFCLPKLERLVLRDLPICQYLPSMNRLECLKELELSGLSSLEYIEENVSAATFCLPKLEKLVLRDLPICRYLPSMNKLECLKELELSGLGSLEYIEENVSAAPFCLPKLEKLVLRDLSICRYLPSMSGLKCLEELELHGLSSLECIKENISTAPFCLPKLEKLVLTDLPICRYLPSMNRLECLKELELSGLSSLEYIEENVSAAPFCLPKLEKLVLRDLLICPYLPSMSELECLKELELSGLSSLEYIEENVSAAPFCLPKLDKLVLRDLPKVKGWCRGNMQWPLLPPFPRLSVLIIYACPNLTVPPLLTFSKLSDLESRVEEGLSPWVEVHIGRLMLSLSVHRDNLSLGIKNFNAIENESRYMAETFRGMSDRWIYLHFSRCSGLKTLPGILQHLSTLRGLMISQCPNFMWEEEEEEKEKQSVADEIQSTSHNSHISWKGLSSLQELYLVQLPNMVRLPEGIQFLTSLQDLYIYDCYNLLIPEWLQNIFPYKKVDGGGKQIHLAKKEMDGCSSSTSI